MDGPLANILQTLAKTMPPQLRQLLIQKHKTEEQVENDKIHVNESNNKNNKKLKMKVNTS